VPRHIIALLEIIWHLTWWRNQRQQIKFYYSVTQCILNAQAFVHRWVTVFVKCTWTIYTCAAHVDAYCNYTVLYIFNLKLLSYNISCTYINCPIKCCYCTSTHSALHTFHMLNHNPTIIIKRKQYINVTVTTNDIRMYNAFIYYVRLKHTVPIVMHTAIINLYRNSVVNDVCSWFTQKSHVVHTCMIDASIVLPICAHSGVVMSSCHIADGRFV